MNNSRLSNLIQHRVPHSCASWLLPLLLLLTLPAVVQAEDYTYWSDGGAITITRYTGPGGAVTIPSTINGLPVTSIGWGAFSECTSLPSVTIPDSVTSIGEYAFFVCMGLTNITIPNSVTCIGAYAFSFCTNLTDVTIPISVTRIEDWAFSDCTRLSSVTIPTSVTIIPSEAFSDCTSLTSVTIGSSVTSIGEFAFYYCTGLTSVYFHGNGPSADSSVFCDANKATVYYLPGTTGWGSTFSGRPTALWFLPNPVILTTTPSFGVQTNRFGFRISWATNAVVVVEASSNLANAKWLPVSTNTLVNGWSDFTDPQWTKYPARFYRLRAL